MKFSVPGGTRANLRYVSDKTVWGEGITEDEKLMLADAQTSGGLLIAVSPDKLDALLAGLSARGVETRAVIGEVIAGRSGKNLHQQVAIGFRGVMGLAPLLVCKTRVTVARADGKPWWVRFPLLLSIELLQPSINGGPMQIDARGKACPHPVMMAEEALSKIGEGIVEVLVDNEESALNVAG